MGNKVCCGTDEDERRYSIGEDNKNSFSIVSENRHRDALSQLNELWKKKAAVSNL